MAECSFPGCLGGEFCHVHANRLGKPCPTCRGKGVRWYSKQNATMPCLWCGGTGLKDSSKRPAKADVVPVEQRGIIQIAGEPEPGPDASTLAESETINERWR